MTADTTPTRCDTLPLRSAQSSFSYCPRAPSAAGPQITDILAHRPNDTPALAPPCLPKTAARGAFKT